MAEPDPVKQLVKFRFPRAGIDISTGRNAQRPDTTIDAYNMRLTDAMEFRDSGGTRAGITRYIPQAMNNGLVQHLNQIVTMNPKAIPYARKCPWTTLDYLTTKITTNYDEANPPVHSSGDYVQTFDWQAYTVFQKRFWSSPSIGDPNAFGSTGLGSAVLTLKCTDADPFNPLIATNIVATANAPTGGIPWDFLSGGTTVEQTATLSCADFLAGSKFTFTWVMVGYPHGALGLVMDFSMVVEVA